MSIIAVVENGSIKLPEDVHLANGTKVEVTFPEEGNAAPPPSGILSWMMKYAGTVEGPEDWAAEHDHYLHGTPKRSAE